MPIGETDPTTGPVQADRTTYTVGPEDLNAVPGIHKFDLEEEVLTTLKSTKGKKIPWWKQKGPEEIKQTEEVAAGEYLAITPPGSTHVKVSSEEAKREPNSWSNSIILWNERRNKKKKKKEEKKRLKNGVNPDLQDSLF